MLRRNATVKLALGSLLPPKAGPRTWLPSPTNIRMAAMVAALMISLLLAIRPLLLDMPHDPTFWRVGDTRER